MAPQKDSVSFNPEPGTNASKDPFQDTPPTDGVAQVLQSGEDTQESPNPDVFVPPPGWNAPGTFLQAVRRMPLEQAQVLMSRSFQLGLGSDASIKDLVGYGTGLDLLAPDEILHISSYAALTGFNADLPHADPSGMPEESEDSSEAAASPEGKTSMCLGRTAPRQLKTTIEGVDEATPQLASSGPDIAGQMSDSREVEEITCNAVIKELQDPAESGARKME